MSCVSCVSCIELPALHCVAQGALSCVSCVCVAFKQARIHKSGRPLFEIFTRPTPQGHNMINATPTTYATRQSQQAILAQIFPLTSLFSHFSAYLLSNSLRSLLHLIQKRAQDFQTDDKFWKEYTLFSYASSSTLYPSE